MIIEFTRRIGPYKPGDRLVCNEAYAETACAEPYPVAKRVVEFESRGAPESGQTAQDRREQRRLKK